MDPSLLKIARRLSQGYQLLFSTALSSAEEATKATTARYASDAEVEYYGDIVNSGMDDHEADTVAKALENFSHSPSVLVVGCGAGREAFGLEKMGCKVTGIDPVKKMIDVAKEEKQKQKSKCEFLVTDLFDLKTKKFDVIYISAAINGHIYGRRERLRFYRRIYNFCHENSLLITLPIISELKPNSLMYYASLVLRFRHLADGNWQPGDTATSFLGRHNDSKKILYYHYYPTLRDFTKEMDDSGFTSWKSNEFIFTPKKQLAFSPSVVHVAKYFPPDNHGGMESFLSDITRGLSDKYAVKCVVTSSYNKTQQESIDNISVLRCASVGRFSSSPISTTYLKALSEIKSDLLHLHVPNPLAALTGTASDIPLVISYHCDVLSYPFLFNFYRPLLIRQLKKARVIVVSSPQLQDSSPILKPFRKKCRVIPFGIDPKDFKIYQNTQNSLRDLKNIYGKKLFLFVGRLVAYKGLTYLIEAMRNVDATLAIVGDGPEMPKLLAQTKESYLQEKVHFFGSVPRANLGAFYKEADAVVLPSIDRREAFGICLVEALSFGKPLVTTSIDTGVNFVNKDQVTGLIAKTKDSADLASKMNSLLNSEKLSKFSQNAKLHFETYFTKAKMISAFDELYQEILQHELSQDF
ncbi:MAG: hypothetical protein A4S09_08420 [Proteobacteria bacterium SG_bin7]|nr:MAG: hypothetical protein A4S09_08420 [Proteobacteria bacterium SG_bin7]